MSLQAQYFYFAGKESFFSPMYLPSIRWPLNVFLYTKTLYIQIVKDGVQFAIDCSRAGPGVLTATCTGPDGQLVTCECKKSGSDQVDD